MTKGLGQASQSEQGKSSRNHSLILVTVETVKCLQRRSDTDNVCELQSATLDS